MVVMDDETMKERFNRRFNKAFGFIFLSLLLLFFMTGCIFQSQNNGSTSAGSAKLKSTSNTIYHVPHAATYNASGSGEPTKLASSENESINTTVVIDGKLYYYEEDNESGELVYIGSANNSSSSSNSSNLSNASTTPAATSATPASFLLSLKRCLDAAGSYANASPAQLPHLGFYAFLCNGSRVELHTFSWDSWSNASALVDRTTNDTNEACLHNMDNMTLLTVTYFAYPLSSSQEGMQPVVNAVNESPLQPSRLEVLYAGKRAFAVLCTQNQSSANSTEEKGEEGKGSSKYVCRRLSTFYPEPSLASLQAVCNETSTLPNSTNLSVGSFELWKEKIDGFIMSWMNASEASSVSSQTSGTAFPTTSNNSNESKEGSAQSEKQVKEIPLG